MKILLGILLLLLLTGGVAFYIGYRIFYMSNTSAEISKSKIVFIPTGAYFEDVMDTLRANHILKHEKSFLWQADLKK